MDNLPYHVLEKVLENLSVIVNQTQEAIIQVSIHQKHLFLMKT